MFSSYKALLQGTLLGAILQALSDVKSVPKGLYYIKCKCDLGSKNCPTCIFPTRIMLRNYILHDNTAQDW